jgi:hypothetical protein
MKVKKIEWERSILGLHATLPMRLHAVIRKRGELYHWSIMRSAMSIVSYFAKSEEQAKADCQKAWEDMVMEAFEKREGCEYCLGKKDISKGRIAIINKNELWSFRVNDDIFARIEYCPKCGRQLLGNSQ